jgi:hypothetical protein
MSSFKLRLLSAISAAAAVTCLSGMAQAQGNSANAPGHNKSEVIPAANHDHDFVLRNAPGKPIDTSVIKEAKDKRRVPYDDAPDFIDDFAAQTARITATSGAAQTTAGLGLDGVGKGFTGPQGAFTVQAAPPDTTGAVGATQYVQWVNSSFAVFDKATGAAVYGPVAGNTLFTGFGGACETSNDGDPVVQYDKQANRWVLMQFAVPTGGPYFQCVAVSRTSDATGLYDRYSFQYTGFNDYPKVGVWPDGYYVTYNIFNGNSFGGARVCAMDRASMLAGLAATQQCFQLSTSYGGLLPADLDGAIAPTAGTPNFVMNMGTNKLNLWKFSVNWATPANSTFTGPTAIPVTAFAAACGGGTCIPQAGTSRTLDSLADRLMYRLAYRKFADGHEALLVNHSVKLGSTRKNTYTGARWYEVRSPNATPVVFQQSSYGPDTTSRWMGSAAMDKQGNIALGYSASSTAIKPAIRFATRLATDAPNTLSNETVVVQGTGSQTGTLSRWGDYSHMSIDPVDDCTFWYTTEYLKADGTFNWSTRIASFKINGCQ